MAVKRDALSVGRQGEAPDVGDRQNGVERFSETIDPGCLRPWDGRAASIHKNAISGDAVSCPRVHSTNADLIDEWNGITGELRTANVERVRH